MTLFLVNLDVLVAPKPDKIWRKKCTPTVALLIRSSLVPYLAYTYFVDLYHGLIRCKLLDRDRNRIRSNPVDLDRDWIRKTLGKYLGYIYFVDLHPD